MKISFEKIEAMIIDVDLLLAAGGTYKKLDAEDTLFYEGSKCFYYYQLVSGKIRWVNINDEGKEFIQTMIEPGECVGELPLFDDEPFAATAIAVKESMVIRLHKTSFLQLIKDNPEIHLSFSKLLAQRTRFKFMILKEFAYHDPEHRISCLFNYFKQNQKNICSKCNLIKLTRQEIADMTGLRVETVIRTVKNLEEKGSLKIKKGKIYCSL